MIASFFSEFCNKMLPSAKPTYADLSPSPGKIAKGVSLSTAPMFTGWAGAPRPLIRICLPAPAHIHFLPSWLETPTRGTSCKGEGAVEAVAGTCQIFITPVFPTDINWLD